LQDPCAPQRGEQALEELHRDLAAARNLADRHGPCPTAPRQLREGADRVRGFRGDGEHGGASLGYGGDAPVTPSIVSRLDPWVPPLALMAVIFGLSAQPDLNSGLGVVDLVGRKIIHMSEYALLCFLWWRALRTVAPHGRAVILAAAVAVAYACTDEYHQHFVRGRHGTPVDVAIDSVGVAAAAFAIRRRGC
jgi:VanZ family protein